MALLLLGTGEGAPILPSLVSVPVSHFRGRTTEAELSIKEEKELQGSRPAQVMSGLNICFPGVGAVAGTPQAAGTRAVGAVAGTPRAAGTRAGTRAFTHTQPWTPTTLLQQGQAQCCPRWGWIPGALRKGGGSTQGGWG